MKKILSVVLAGAMVLGMSVASFAKANDTSWGEDKDNTVDAPKDVKVENLFFGNIMEVVRTNGKTIKVNADNDEFKTGFRPGDVLYFTIVNGDEGAYTEAIDKDWRINISANDYVESAEFVGKADKVKKVKVVLAENLDELDVQEINFHMYIADNGSKHTKESASATVKYDFKNYEEEIVDFKHINDVDYTAKWIVEADKRGVATFDFEDVAYFTVKMYPEEEVILNFDNNVDKDLVKEYRDVDFEFYNFNGSKDEFLATGELLLPSADEDAVVYEVVDGKLKKVDAEYVEDYKVAGVDKKDGFVVKTAELGHYVVASEELEIEEEEAKKPESGKEIGRASCRERV